MHACESESRVTVWGQLGATNSSYSSGRVARGEYTYVACVVDDDNMLASLRVVYAITSCENLYFHHGGSVSAGGCCSCLLLL